jgi:hypothetical protein
MYGALGFAQKEAPVRTRRHALASTSCGIRHTEGGSCSSASAKRNADQRSNRLAPGVSAPTGPQRPRVRRSEPLDAIAATNPPSASGALRASRDVSRRSAGGPVGLGSRIRELDRAGGRLRELRPSRRSAAREGCPPSPSPAMTPGRQDGRRCSPAGTSRSCSIATRQGETPPLGSLLT